MLLDDSKKSEILDLLAKARKADKGFDQFGSSTHEYLLNPTIKPEKVRAIEERYKFKLPEDYFWFITEVGNGGAGPGYGIYQFSSVIDDYEFDYLNREPLLTGKMPKEDYDKFYKDYMLEVQREKDHEKSREIYLKFNQGLMLIATTGLNSDLFLVITGENRGRVLFSDEENPPQISTHPNFIEWYLNWLNLTVELYEK